VKFVNLSASYKRVIIALVAIALLVLLEISTYVFLKKEYKERKDNYLITLTNEWEEEYHSLIRRYKMVADTIAYGLNSDSELVRILKRVNSTGDIEKAHAEIMSSYSELNRANETNSIIRIFQIHDNKGNVLVRFQKPNAYGDNVLNYLQIVALAHKDKKHTEGFDSGKYFNGYRYVYPLVHNGVFLGSLQLGYEEVALNNMLMNDFRVNAYVAVDADKSNVIDAGESPLSSQKKKLVHHNGAYPKETQELILKLFNGRQAELDKAMDSSDRLVFSTQIANAHYAVTTEPFVNFKHQNAGYLTLYAKDSNLPLLEKEYHISLALGFLLAALLSGILTAIFYGYYNKSVELELKEKILMQQSKMAVMGEMIGVIAHQWRQPLNAIYLSVQDIYAAYEVEELDKEYMDKFKESNLFIIKKMSETIDDFRNFLRPVKDMTNFSVEQAVDGVLRILTPQFKRNSVELKFDKSGEHVVHGHQNELEQTIMILLSNALDALIENKINHPAINISIGYNEHGGTILSIQDNAGGVPHEICEKIFEPYFTTKDKSNGTGIGLYMAREIVEHQMGGKIYFENVDDGVRFVVELNANL